MGIIKPRKRNKSSLKDNKCRTCTSYLNEKLPKPSCHTFCPKNNPVEDIEKSIRVNTTKFTSLDMCPKCYAKSLIWHKDRLIYECLNCDRTYTVKALENAQCNRRAESEAGGYLEAGDGYDA